LESKFDIRDDKNDITIKEREKRSANSRLILKSKQHGILNKTDDNIARNTTIRKLGSVNRRE